MNDKTILCSIFAFFGFYFLGMGYALLNGMVRADELSAEFFGIAAAMFGGAGVLAAVVLLFVDMPDDRLAPVHVHPG